MFQIVLVRWFQEIKRRFGEFAYGRVAAIGNQVMGLDE